jgi:hypothetical protein
VADRSPLISELTPKDVRGLEEKAEYLLALSDMEDYHDAIIAVEKLPVSLHPYTIIIPHYDWTDLQIKPTAS